MKKIKLDGRLSLNKETIATLNDEQMNGVKGGANVLSWGEFCTRRAECDADEWTKGIFCNKHKPLA